MKEFIVRDRSVHEFVDELTGVVQRLGFRMKTEVFFHDSVFHQSQKGGNARTSIAGFFVRLGAYVRVVRAHICEVEIFHDGPDLRVRFLVYPISYMPDAGKVLTPGESPEMAVLKDKKSIDLLDRIIEGLEVKGSKLEPMERT